MTVFPVREGYNDYSYLGSVESFAQPKGNLLILTCSSGAFSSANHVFNVSVKVTKNKIVTKMRVYLRRGNNHETGLVLSVKFSSLIEIILIIYVSKLGNRRGTAFHSLPVVEENEGWTRMVLHF